MMGHKEKINMADEYHAFTGWRRFVGWNRGEIRKIKQRFNRRIRRKVKQELAPSSNWLGHSPFKAAT